MRLAFCLLPALILGCAPAQPVVHDGAKPAAKRAYAYGTPDFDSFVRTSYEEPGAKGVESFNAWLNGSLLKYSGKDVEAWVASHREKLEGAKDKTKAELDFCRDIHKTIKKIIPRFNLDRGFEFYNTVSKAERQCFLQAVLIAGLGQKCGLNVGVVMVNRNIAGDPSNNGHCVPLFRLADGRHVIVDSSDPIPFVEQKGLLVGRASTGSYRYVSPIYGPGSAITGFTDVGTGKKLNPSDVIGVDNAYLASQFDYYRGERAPGGIFQSRPTPAGLQASARYLKRAVGHCPENPLAVYQLGRVLRRLGQEREGMKYLQDAKALYAKYGWTPEGMKTELARK